MVGEIVLRDIHTPAAPPWWPPAPGWWLLLALLVVVLVAVSLWRVRHARRRKRAQAMFDEAVAAAEAAPAQVAVMSELLRRAARRDDPAADRLQGDAWLAFLDGAGRGERRRGNDADAPMAFSRGPGRLLLDGGFRRELDSAEVDALHMIARARFVEWMTKR